MIGRRSFRHSARLPAEIVWVVAGQIAAAICAVVGMRFLTQLLPPAEYGVLALALTVGALMQQVVFGPVANAVLRFYSTSAARGELPRMLRAASSLFARAALALIVCAIAVEAVGTLRVALGGWAMIATASAFALVSGLNGVLAATHSAARRRSVVAAHQGLSELLRFGLAVAFVHYSGSSSVAALCGFVIGVGITCVSQSLVLWRSERHARPNAPSFTNEPRAIEQRWRRQLTQYARPFALWGGFTWVVLASDRWSLQAFQSTADVGRYAALLQLGSYPITMAASVLVQLAAPVLFARAADASDPALRSDSRRLNYTLTFLVLAATAVATAAAVLLYRPLFNVLIGEAYREVSWMLPVVVLSAGLFAAGQQLALTLQSDLRVDRLVVPKIGSSIVGIAGFFAGARWWGMPGVVWAGVLYAAVHLVWIALARAESTIQRVAPADVVAELPPVSNA